MSNSSISNFIVKVKQNPLIGIVIISSFSFFGIIGIISDYRDWFIEKTAFNLFLSFLILILYQRNYDWKLLAAFIFCYIIGFVAEYLGVNFGLIFGEYIYPDTLGAQIAGVPIIIGINWFLITFCIAAVILPMRSNGFIKIVIATTITVLIDVLIEPVAMKLTFWNWEGGIVPLQNYLGWALVSFLIFSFYSIVKLSVKNSMAVVLLIWQVLFFAALNIFIIY